MAKVRELKKAVKSLSADMAAETIIAAELIKGYDKAKVNEILHKVAEFQANTLAKVKFAFDKVPADFETKAAFNKAKYVYYKQAYKKLTQEIQANAKAIVDEMNAAMPKLD